MGTAPSWQSVLVALGYLVLVGMFYVVGLAATDTTDDFLKVWAAVGSIVGVITGAIPTFFFKAQADRANARSNALAAAATPEAYAEARNLAPKAFSD